MAITTIDQALAGMKQPQWIAKAVGGTMVAGRAHSFWQIAGIPPAATVVGTSIAITTIFSGSAALVLSATHGLNTGDTVSIGGTVSGSPKADGNYMVTVVSGSTFTIPLSVSGSGTGGVLSVLSSGVAGSRAAGAPGEVLIGRAGGIPFTDPTAGQSSYLARFQASATISGTLLLSDRLWQNAGINPVVTTYQPFTASGSIPPRDVNGSSAGTGVYALVECASALGNGTPTITLTYTNSSGSTGRTGTNLMATANTPTLGDAFTIGLQAGDDGIRRVEGITLSSTYTSGVISVVLYVPICALELTGAYIPNAVDALTGGFAHIYDDSTLFLLFIPSTTTTSNINGQMIYSQG